jgi:hypothetical protein
MVRVVAVVVAIMRCARRDAVRALAGIGPAAIGRPGPSEGVGKCRDRATPRYEYICKSSHPPKLHRSVYQGGARCERDGGAPEASVRPIKIPINASDTRPKHEPRRC